MGCFGASSDDVSGCFGASSDDIAGYFGASSDIVIMIQKCGKTHAEEMLQLILSSEDARWHFSG